MSAVQGAFHDSGPTDIDRCRHERALIDRRFAAELDRRARADEPKRGELVITLIDGDVVEPWVDPRVLEAKRADRGAAPGYWSSSLSRSSATHRSRRHSAAWAMRAS
jgi:hypothetical protein